MTLNQNRLVCLCNQVSLKEIRKILKSGALTTAEIQQFTAAGTGCGRCRTEVEAIVEKYRLTARISPQMKIKFE